MSKRETGEYEARLNQEIERRIGEMEREDYGFPRRFSRLDYGVWAVVTALCAALILLGARL